MTFDRTLDLRRRNALLDELEVRILGDQHPEPDRHEVLELPRHDRDGTAHLPRRTDPGPVVGETIGGDSKREGGTAGEIPLPHLSPKRYSEDPTREGKTKRPCKGTISELSG